MHIEILVEDVSGKKALDIITPKILGDRATFSVHSYKGVGRIPQNLRGKPDPSKRILLSNLPRLLGGFGRAFSGYGEGYKAAVIVICDLDQKDLNTFLKELNAALDSCNPKPETYFCIAVEESEAWLLGDIPAIKSAYPKAKDQVLKSYVNDSICGTWELLADALLDGGHRGLAAKGWHIAGRQKSEWAENITPHMNPDANLSNSFNYFKSSLLKLVK